MLKFYLRSYLVPGLIILLLWMKFGPPVMKALDEAGIVTRKGTIAFASNRDGNWEIYTMNPDGSRLHRLTHTGGLDESSPAWSPDGQRIAFVSQVGKNQDIEVIKANGKNRRKLTHHSGKDADPCWSPDGEKIVFASHRDGNGEIYVINADGTGLKRLTFHCADDWSPRWQPGSNLILFLRKISVKKGSLCYLESVYAVTADDGDAYDVTPKMPRLGNIPSWSKEGNMIAFSGSNDVSQKRGVIYTLKRGNWFLRQVTFRGDGEFDEHPTWSPDGKKIAFSRRILYHRKPTDIYVVDLSKSEVMNITNGVGDNNHPDWY